jgi:hypothetical protein
MPGEIYVVLEEEVTPMYMSSEKMRLHIDRLNKHIRSLENSMEICKKERLPLIQELHRRQHQERLWVIKDKAGNVTTKITPPRVPVKLDPKAEECDFPIVKPSELYSKAVEIPEDAPSWAKEAAKKVLLESGFTALSPTTFVKLQ